MGKANEWTVATRDTVRSERTNGIEVVCIKVLSDRNVLFVFVLKFFWISGIFADLA